MDFNNFLVASKWDILKILSKKPASPIEIAEELGTTVSYVSQQLKILDAAGLITKYKTGFIEKGKPRNLFSVREDLAYLVLLTKGFGDQKLLGLTPEKECILKTWMVGDPSIHTPSINFFLSLSPYWKNILAIYVVDKKFSKIFIVSDDSSLKQKFLSFSSKFFPKSNLNFSDGEGLEVGENWIPLHVSPEFSNILKGGSKLR
ncbi:hypothetical protein B6U91_02390 [Candidatus Pacearchaeota archaeon ex4484_71]|nr:MAG: hypothetical protein B6U91_02390 [Candidatus Pacearchaeota archaeon ex4484_71]